MNQTEPPFKKGDELIAVRHTELFTKDQVYICTGCERASERAATPYSIGVEGFEGGIMFRTDNFELNSPRTKVDDIDQYLEP